MSVSRSAVVSVVIVNFKGTDDTLECVARLNDVNWPKDRLEIVIVENGSDDDSEARLRAALGSQKNVKIVVSDDNLGFTGGSNLGASHARGEFVAFLNNDAKPDVDWITKALEQFAISPSVAAVASKVLDWEGKEVDFLEGGLTWYGMGYNSPISKEDQYQFDVPRDILFGTGSALFVRRAIFADVGGFDERLFMFYDDVDLGWRLNLFGYRVRFAPESLVFHKHHGSMKSFGEHREMYLLERNSLFLLYKNLDDASLAKFLPGALALLGRRAVAKSGLDSASFDIRRFEGDPDEFDLDTPVRKDAVAGLFALDQFVEELPSLQEARNEVQAKRTRTDNEIFRLFGDIFKPLFGNDYYLDGMRSIVDSFGIFKHTERRHVLVITGDAIGEKMAGPAMRAWKISEALAQSNDVRLLTWNVADRKSNLFAVDRVRLQNERDMKVHEEWADVIVFQGHVLHHFKTLQRTTKVMVVDLYDPMHLEQLEQGRELGLDMWKNQVRSATEVLNEQLLRGDYFLCASERQRIFWLGQLAGLGRINPENYAAEENLNNLISIVPFGLDSTPPRHERKAIRGVVPGISDTDKVVIWGGGLYSWFDPLTLVRAIALLAKTHPEVRLFFLGVKHPNPDVPEMAIVATTRELARSLGLYDKNVFFNEQWVKLDDRQNYLLEADAGVSTHYDHIETQFSFRTRILDYMWANLPIVTTRGDSFGDLVAAEGMGASVPERDVEALAEALERVLFDEKAQKAARENVSRVREEFTWEKSLAPLVAFCNDPQPAPDRVEKLFAATHAGPHARPVRGLKSSEERFHEIANSRHGISRDIALAHYYLTDGGGVSALRTKVKDRLASNRASKFGKE